MRKTNGIFAIGGLGLVTTLAFTACSSTDVGTSPANGTPPNTSAGAVDASTVTADSSSVDADAPTFAIGGEVRYLTTSGLVLSLTDNAGAAADDGGDSGADHELQTADVSAAGAFAFATPLADGVPYRVRVKTQPTGQTCAVTAGASGTIASANIANVIVACQTTIVFAATGAEQTWQVPAGITSVAIEAFGAAGSSGDVGGTAAALGGPGGLGGHAVGVLTTTAGEALSIFVGGVGTIPTGGFNGGGNGAAPGARGRGAGGGGASDVRQGGNALANRKLVAGGGGGGGGAGCEADTISGGAGGAGGGGAGTKGTDSANGGGGNGGTISSSGTGGIGCIVGASGSGANGGAGEVCCCYTHHSDPSGGGGGGGYVQGTGGGGGTAGTISCTGNDKGGGGGGSGGSSRADASDVANGMTEDGVRAGDGVVRITYPAL